LSGRQNGHHFDELNKEEGAHKQKSNFPSSFFAILNNNHKSCLTSKENFGIVFAI